MALRYPEQKPVYAGYARHGLDFLETVLWDRQQGGFFWGLDESGKISPRYGTGKHVYGIAFAVYASAAVYQATHEPRALELAKRAFVWLDRHAHDSLHGGYYEALTRSGEPILRPTPAADWNDAARGLDFIGTKFGYKSMNSHIHLLECSRGCTASGPTLRWASGFAKCSGWCGIGSPSSRAA